MTGLFSKYKVLIPLLLVVFIDEMGCGLFFPLLTPLIYDPMQSILHHSATAFERQLDYGLVLAIFPLMMFLSAPILGDLSDHYGRKKILILSLIGTGIGYVLSALGVLTHHFYLLLLGRALDGLTAGNFPIAQAAIIDVSAPKDRTANLSLMVFAISLGFIVGPALAGVLSNAAWVSWFNLSTPMFMAAVLSVLNVVFIIFVYRETFEPKESGFRFNLRQAVGLFQSAFTEKTISKLSILLLLLLLAWGSYIQYVSVFLYRVYHFDNSQLAMFMVAMSCSLSVASMLIIRVLKWYLSDARITQIAFVASILGISVTVLSHTVFYAWVGLIPLSMGIALGHAAIMALFSNQVDESRQGWVMGVSGAVVSLSILTSAVVNAVIGEFNPRNPFWLSLSAYLIGFIVITLYCRQQESEEHLPQ